MQTQQTQTENDNAYMKAVLEGYHAELSNLIEILKETRIRRRSPLQDAAVKSLGLSRRVLKELIDYLALGSSGSGAELPLPHKKAIRNGR